MKFPEPVDEDHFLLNTLKTIPSLLGTNSCPPSSGSDFHRSPSTLQRQTHDTKRILSASAI